MRTNTSAAGELLRLDDALSALGHDGVLDDRLDEVPLDDIVGTVARSADFDGRFGLVNHSLCERWDRLARAIANGFDPPPVQLVQLGELYFVEDGHHRVSVARSLGRQEIAARVRRICTVAYAMACLRQADLASKEAERRFLARVPLPEEVRRDLWLDDPATWARLGDAAEAWAWRRAIRGAGPVEPCTFAAEWWAEEVVPVLTRLRAAGVGLDLRDVQLYAAALAIRDRRGTVTWPPGVTSTPVGV